MSKYLAGLLLRLHGWRPEGERPPVSSFVVLAAPHTSNWDFYYLMLFGRLFGLRLSWLGKHTLFRFPMGWIMRTLGGIPVQRSRSAMRVRSLERAFRSRDDLVLVIPAEGTRRSAERWKSGFYHIARSANVPIALAFLDYRRKVGGFGPLLWPSDDVRRDMDVVRDFYADKTGRRPRLFVQPRLAEEDIAEACAGELGVEGEER